MPAPTPTERPTLISYDATRDPATMSPDERRREVAAILARGILRLRQSAENTPGSCPSRTLKKSSNLCQKALDEGAKTSVHVATRQPLDRRKKRRINT